MEILPAFSRPDVSHENVFERFALTDERGDGIPYDYHPPIENGGRGTELLHFGKYMRVE